MSTHPSRSIFLYLLGLLLLLAPVLGVPGTRPAFAQEESDPFSLGEAFPPRSVVFSYPDARPETIGDEVVLLDAEGRRVPLTGAKVLLEGSSVRVFPPRLPNGVYTVQHPGGTERLEVGVPAAPIEAVTGEVSTLPRLLPLSALLPALLLFVRGRRVVGVFVALAGAGTSAALLLLGSSSPALPQGDPCLGRPDLTECATSYVVGVLEDFGPETATGELLRLSGGQGSPWARICHEPAHELGIRTWISTGSLEKSIDAGTTACSLGYVHGMLQAMGTYLTDEEFPAAARGLCDGLDERYRAGELIGAVEDGPSTLLGCHHGVGHAAMWRVNEDLERAVPVCAGFADVAQQEECRVGAVMEWVYADQRASRSGVESDRPSPRVERPVDLCLPPLGVLSPGCVEGAVTAVGPDGIDATRAWCVEHPDVLPACVQSLARRMVQMDLSKVAPLLGTVEGFCRSFGDAYSGPDCTERFGYMLLFLSRDLERTEGFCATLPADLAAGCTAGVEKVLEYAREIGDTSFNFGD
jgi:hypothetical protein